MFKKRPRGSLPYVPQEEPEEAKFAKEPCEGVATCVQEQRIEKPTSTPQKKGIIIAGPTGTGKTLLSLNLAAKIRGEIVSADSMQVYRGMDIGTAKVLPKDKARIPHHLIDIRNITEPFNVKDFCEEAKAACEDIFLRGKVPIIVGGTGFYIHALLYGPPSGPPTDLSVRKALQKEEEKYGIEFLYDKLRAFDPAYAETITPTDKHKVIRALEIIELSGKKVSDFSWKRRTRLPYCDWRSWFVFRPRNILYKLLESRCEEMLQQGLLEEVVELDRAGIRSNLTASQAIGYRQTLDFLDSGRTKEDYEQYVKNLKMASRHLAKKQFTWFRKEQHFQWLDMSRHSLEEIADIIIDDFEGKAPTALLPEDMNPEL